MDPGHLEPQPGLLPGLNLEGIDCEGYERKRPGGCLRAGPGMICLWRLVLQVKDGHETIFAIQKRLLYTFFPSLNWQSVKMCIFHRTALLKKCLTSKEQHFAVLKFLF